MVTNIIFIAYLKRLRIEASRRRFLPKTAPERRFRLESGRAVKLFGSSG